MCYLQMIFSLIFFQLLTSEEGISTILKRENSCEIDAEVRFHLCVTNRISASLIDIRLSL